MIRIRIVTKFCVQKIFVYFEPLGLSSLRKTTSSLSSDFDRLELHPQVSIRETSRAFRFAETSDR